MKRIVLLTVILFIVLIQQNATACDCMPMGPFLKVAPKTDFVALVKVTKYLSFQNIDDHPIPMSMEVSIIDVYKGKEVRKTLTVWGDNGALCRPYLSQFRTGNYYVIAFIPGSDGTKGHVHSDEKTSDYAISVCGDYCLKVDTTKRMAIGYVDKNQNQISLGKLK